MIEAHYQNYAPTPLDPQLLATPYAVQTRWHVISGAPCSGKTTLIEMLAARGYQTVPETGRRYIEREIAAGRTLAEIRRSDVDFSHVVRELQLATEHSLQPEELIFLDRGYPDCLSFYRLSGLDPNEILPDCFHHRYAGVFVLDRFPTRVDCARIEDDAAAGLIDAWLARDYTSLGYSVVRVPVLPPGERLAFILERIKNSF